MNITISPAFLSGTVRANPSKSQAHRALICAALADSPTFIQCHGTSADIAATADCLSMLGAKTRSTVKEKFGGFSVTPINREADDENPVILPCNESGSTFRFLLPITAALGRTASFRLNGRLPERPLTPLYEEMVRNGCEMSEQGSNPFLLKGRLKPGHYKIGGNVSSQFISGLLFALPLLEDNSKLEIIGTLESASYVDMTLEMLGLFGIHIGYDGKVFSVKGNQTYRSPERLSIEGDWSNAAFWLAANAVGDNDVTCTGLNSSSMQGDMAVAAIIEKYQNSETLMSPVKINARNIPDLIPILSVVAAATDVTTVIYNAERLRIKESDRLTALADVLRALTVDVTEKPDGLVIKGSTPPFRNRKNTVVDCVNDHRIAMSAAIAATACKYPVTIEGAEAVNKSYPEFFDELNKLIQR